jgi:hypothetical protein
MTATGPSGTTYTLWQYGMLPSQRDKVIKDVLKNEYNVTPQSKEKVWQAHTSKKGMI